MIPPNLLPVPLGQTVATPAALEVLSQPDIVAALRRHSAGDWGDVDDEDRAGGNRLGHAETMLRNACAGVPPEVWRFGAGGYRQVP